MKSLTPLSEPPLYIEIYTRIRDSKRNPTRDELIAAHGYVVERYTAFSAAIAAEQLNTLTIDPRSRALEVVLRSCYDGKTKPLGELKRKLKSSQATLELKYCPSCSTTIHSTFDHYLPTKKFPELAVHALNLVPCCGICNSTKDDDWLSDTGHRQFIHPFLDAIPAGKFLTVNLVSEPQAKAPGATFELIEPPGISPDIWRLISSHFMKLRLISRYNELANDEIAEIIKNARDFLHAGGPNARNFIAITASTAADLYGESNWRSLLMYALAGHAHFDRWVGA